MAGNRVISPEDLGAIPVNDSINHAYGAGDHAVEKPTRDISPQVLVLEVESGSFRFIPGYAEDSAMDSGAPSADVTDGSGSLLLTTGRMYVFAAPSEFTVSGNSATDILTYWWA